jgi:hypothetical protein
MGLTRFFLEFPDVLSMRNYVNLEDPAEIKGRIGHEGITGPECLTGLATYPASEGYVP